jgi:hypothetical protein
VVSASVTFLNEQGLFKGAARELRAVIGEEGVMAAFARMSAADATAWTQEYFPSTVTSRRHAAYAEHPSAVKRAIAEAAAI